MSKKFLEYPLVLDWLQWSEFRHSHTEPINYPQTALTLISDMRAEIKRLEDEGGKDYLDMRKFQAKFINTDQQLRSALNVIHKFRMYLGEERYVSLVTESRANSAFYPEPGGQAQPNLNDNPPHTDDEAW